MIYNNGNKVIQIGGVNQAWDSSMKIYQYYKPASGSPTPPAHDYSQDYLTFEVLATEDVGQLRFTYNFSGDDIQYSLDSGSTWVTMPSGTSTPNLSVGDKVMFKGNNNNLDGTRGVGHFTSTCNFNAMGNLASMYDADNFRTITTAPGQAWGAAFFDRNVGLVSAENLYLIDHIAPYCYNSMFNGCTSLIAAPELPATTLATRCYENMFVGCTSLVNAPELPATGVAIGCYSNMFAGCTSLVNAPELKATNFYWDCYVQMFMNCTSLSYVKCMGVSNSDPSADISQWLYNVSATGTFVKPAEMTSYGSGASGIPSGWTVQNA